MRNADETVQKLLVSLRDAKPADDMEQRILAAVQHAAAAREAARVRAGSVLWPAWSRQTSAMLLAGAAVLIVGLVLVVTAPHWKAPANAVNIASDANARRMAKPMQVGQKPAAAIGHTGSVVSIMRTQNRRAFKSSAAPRSFPAPPLPLTQQERLLLRLARRRNPASLTILNPDVQRAQDAQATEQFRQFFGMNAQEMRTQLE